ncbi:MAG TPA: hypothetical protein PK872_02850 [Ferruginibacter sp.]|nr:hypothetical protein [Ferruginibacter sp.]
MTQQQILFLKHDAAFLLPGLSASSTGKWGVMNAQEMVEHLTDFFDISYEKITIALVTPVEHLPQYRAFIYSDKEFRPNTKAPVEIIGDKPFPLRCENLDEAKEKLVTSINKFFLHFEFDAGKATLHPVFGILNFEDWVLLHGKHVRHHYRQFGLLD